MSIPPDSLWRGAAARFREPVNEGDELHAQFLMASIDQYNSSPNSTYYPVYRSSDGESDILRHVFRFDNAPYQYVFENGFEARRQAGTPDELFCNLERYANSGGRPLDTRRETTHVFVSTTISSHWHPSVNHGESVSVYRYEIYAPGGIVVTPTLEDRYNYSSQDEITFIEGIAPQYIRSAQLFRLTSMLTSDGRYRTRRTRENTTLYINRNFNPQSHPERRLQIQNPVRYYYDENCRRRDLEIQEFPELPERRRRSLDTNDALIEYYEDGVTNVDNYIDSAFRSTRRDEVYIFIKKEYVLMNYAPGTTDDRIVNGPHFIGNSFPSLVGTAFAEYGIDAAFGCHDGDEAMIFSGNLCARINYAPGTTDDWIVEGPKTITQMFPFFQGTNFEQGIDAAFESTRHGEAYLFKGSEYALIHYSSEHGRTLVAIRPIADGFPCLRGCEFERDIQAAFASHRANEAYLFKGNSYILLYFTPGDTKDYIIGGPKEIVPTNWPSLKDFVPRKNGGMDVYDFQKDNPPRDKDHDEL